MDIKHFLAVAVFIVLDIVTGLIKAFKNGEYSSSKMRQGLFHKLGEISAVLFGLLCENLFPIVGINVDMPIVSAIVIYIVLMECGSITENLGNISPEIGDILSGVFDKFKNE